ncbi:MAG: chloride channel protein [Polyangia bacterium]
MTPADPTPPPREPLRLGSLLTLLRTRGAPLDLQVLGRTLMHTAVVGLAAGLIGAAFFACLEYAQRFVLQDIAGYLPLRASGENFFDAHRTNAFRPWLLVFLPGLGALLAGLVIRYAPEVAGGGGDAMIRAFHEQGGVVPRRVIWAKSLASIFTLGFGGSGGREGPTMHIGASLGSTLGSMLGVTARERRILMIAGVAAGMSAVFRTPLGAALLAVEVMYRDDFESDALIPAVLASVVSYSVVIAIFGESTLFGRPARYPFHPVQLPLFALMAILVALLASLFVRTLRGVEHRIKKLNIPPWTKPALGGLALGIFSTPIVMYIGHRTQMPGQGLGLLGGGYGAAQMAISGVERLPGGWQGIEILLLLCGAKLVASSLTIGSGGSAGDFAPSLVLGGLLGGAFGRAAQLLLHDPSIDPGAFALVGMGTFFGGVAHAPLSALILVSEMAGSYDLLVPLMMTSGIAFVALRRTSLYEAQLGAKHDSPVHRASTLLEPLRVIRVRDVMVTGRPFVTFGLKTPGIELIVRIDEQSWQDTFPVLGEEGKLAGVVSADALRSLAATREVAPMTIAADLMHQPVFALLDDDLRSATAQMLDAGLRELPVLDDKGQVVGFIDEMETAKAYLEATASRMRPPTLS